MFPAIRTRGLLTITSPGSGQIEKFLQGSFINSQEVCPVSREAREDNTSCPPPQKEEHIDPIQLESVEPEGCEPQIWRGGSHSDLLRRIPQPEGSVWSEEVVLSVWGIRSVVFWRGLSVWRISQLSQEVDLSVICWGGSLSRKDEPQDRICVIWRGGSHSDLKRWISQSEGSGSVCSEEVVLSVLRFSQSDGSHSYPKRWISQWSVEEDLSVWRISQSEGSDLCVLKRWFSQS